MKIISKPARKSAGPRPPWRTIFITPGTIAENDGIHWVLKRDVNRIGSGKWWERCDD